MARVELAFLWHMHQPPYRDPESGSYVLPWVRLHATRGYLDMARIHARHPTVRGTVNFTPVLLQQLEDYAAGRGHDRYLELTELPAADLGAPERKFLLRNFFMVSWEQGVRPLPRYRELLHLRGADMTDVDLDEVATRFGDDELRDLQVLFNLAWMGFSARAEEEVVRELIRKGRGFSEDDKRSLLEAQARIVASVIPAWQEVAGQGAIELSATPFYHPILPLICDTDVAQVAMPGVELPPRLRARDDAEAHVIRACREMERLFGAAPEGMWPAEGSVSPEALEVFAGAGARWLASDEEVLFRSLPHGADRVSSLFRPWRVRAGDRELTMVFRDRGISDAIGFQYARSPAVDAVADLLGNLSRIADAAPRTGGEPPVVAVILDGENPWEFYPESGRHFLEDLFRRLEAREAGIETTTIGARAARGAPPDRIERIHAGSWIDANFRIWIGHPEERAAWALVGEAKEALRDAERTGASEESLAAAREQLLAAQASDWFWWYGEDFLTETKSDFDRLFRSRIQAVFRLLGRASPTAAFTPIGLGRGLESSPFVPPAGFLRPRLDGRETSWLEWLGAGSYHASEARGIAMHQAVGSFEELRFGFDPEHLHLRLDPRWEDSARLLTEVDELRLDIELEEGRIEIGVKLRAGQLLPYSAEEGTTLGAGCLGSIVEMSFGLSELGLRAGQAARFAVRGMRGAVEVERLPTSGWLTFEVPDESFEQRTWKV
ncbi:MAG TPA: glycoside hydrolase family 57 protein [Vulgatibacter sp.]|nr:glycoside hydrolase family 57 protein [Vulgatibacter sp.]